MLTASGGLLIIVTDPQGGNTVLPMLFLVAFIYSIIRSHAKLKTVLFTLGSMVLAIALAAAAGWVVGIGPAASGTLSGMFALLFGIVISLAHSRKSIQKAHAQTMTGPIPASGNRRFTNKERFIVACIILGLVVLVGVITRLTGGHW